MSHTPTLWSTRVSDNQYQMIGKPTRDGWANFQCLSNLERVREWNLNDMRPLNDQARAILAKVRA